MATSRQTVIDVKVPPKAVGAVIGRQGAMIKEVQNVHIIYIINIVIYLN